MAGRRYDTDELQLIATLRRRGLSISKVASQLGRTPNGIQGALRAQRWVDPKQSKIMGSVHVFTPEQKEAFLDFVRWRCAGRTPPDIRDEWNREALKKGWPTVNNERVAYYLRKLGLEKTKREYMQYASYRRRQSTAQRCRRVKEREAQRLSLRAQRAVLYEREPNLPRRKCQVCSETWPLTEDFFRHAGNCAKYFLSTCRLCSHRLPGTAAERRRQRMDAYDRRVLLKQIPAAKAERDVFLHQHPKFPTRRCSCCHETWELLPKRFLKYKLARSFEQYARTCRFCFRAAERLKERQRKVPVRIPTTLPAGELTVKKNRNEQFGASAHPPIVRIADAKSVQG